MDETICTRKYGFIVRTNAGEASREEIEAEAKTGRTVSASFKTAPYGPVFCFKTSEPVWIEMLRNTYTCRSDLQSSQTILRFITLWNII